MISGPLIGNCGYNQETAGEAIVNGGAGLISVGRSYISDPDLIERLTNGWPLSQDGEVEDWCTPAGAEGCTDFPVYSGAE